MLFRVFASILICMGLIACEERGELSERTFVLPEDVANSYLTLLNPQQALSSDLYSMVIVPQSPLSPEQQGSYVISLTDLGSESLTSSYQGQWDENSELDWLNNTLNQHELDLTENLDLSIQVQCSLPCQLNLVKGDYLYQQKVSDDAFLIEYSIENNQINSAQYAEQYYLAVDPNDERTTLTDWKSKNGFDQGYDVHVIFRDSKDLGYGRDMYARKNEDGSLAFFVNNFVVVTGKGNPANYGPLNLFAATDQNFDYHLGSNAIEFSPINPDDPDSDKVLKFFTFTAKDEQLVQHRLIAADLDGRGTKYMPSICLACHGGNLLPLNTDNSFNHLSLISAKLNQLEVNSFEFKASGIYTRAEQEAGIKLINQWVRDSYAEMGARDATQVGYWDSRFVEEVANGRYGGETFDLASYQEDAVPEGWQQTDYRPEGVESLYLQVIEPHCISCHSLRGYAAGDDDLVEPVIINGEKIKLGNAINFSSYEKFISYSDIIIDYVYRRGVMPLSLRNAELFWQPPYSAPALLANFLPGFDVLNSDGEIQPPGLPVARLELQRLANFPVRLNGEASYFAQTFQWTIISGPVGHDGSLENADQKIAELTGSMNGEYVIGLQVANSRGSHSTEMNVIIDNTREPATALNFVDDIKPLLQTQLFNLRTCQSCHNPVVGVEGIPVHYDDTNDQLYADVRARVNLKAPMDSLLLQKPTRHQHGGGKRFDLGTSLGEESYNTILQWIVSGAPCGNDPLFCL